MIRLCRDGAYKRGLSLLLVALVAIVGLAGCGDKIGGTIPPTGTQRPGTSFGPPPTANGSTTPISIDTTLLAVLPREIASIPVIESPEGESDAMADTVLPTIATAAVAAVVVDTSTNDLVYAVVVRLKPVFTATTYRDWRDSYDEGACLGVNNVLGHAQTAIAGRTVYIGTCVNGLRTYHTWLEDKQILVSASSTGTREFGVLLMGTLRT